QYFVVLGFTGQESTEPCIRRRYLGQDLIELSKIVLQRLDQICAVYGLLEGLALKHPAIADRNRTLPGFNLNELVANERVGPDVGYRIDGDTLQEPAQHTHPHLYHALRVEQSGQSNVAHFADPDSVQADF